MHAPAKQDLNSKFTILLSEVRTEIEATKWVSTRACLPRVFFPSEQSTPSPNSW